MYVIKKEQDHTFNRSRETMNTLQLWMRPQKRQVSMDHTSKGSFKKHQTTELGHTVRVTEYLIQKEKRQFAAVPIAVMCPEHSQGRE